MTADQWVKISDRMPGPGLKVLVFFKNELGNGRRTLAHFTPARTDCADNYDYQDWQDEWLDVDESGTSWVPEGWYEDSQTQECCPQITQPVTHWMPLPEYPHG